MNRSAFCFYISVLALLFTGTANAQQGTQVTLWGGPQLVSLVNVDDYLSLYNPAAKLTRLSTFRYGGGVDFIYNFRNSYGVQSGVYYSQQGQKYEGFAQRSSNDPGVNYTSHIYINYIRVPLMMRFNSEFADEDRMNLSIFGGIQLGFLRNVQEVVTNPPPHDTLLSRYPDFDFRDLYKKTDLGLAMGAQFNIKITSKVYTMLGIRYDRSFGTIENRSFKLPKDAPSEWQYPVSTKKGVGGTDNSTRNPTRVSAVNLYTGLTFNFGSAPTAAQ